MFHFEKHISLKTGLKEETKKTYKIKVNDLDPTLLLESPRMDAKKHEQADFI